MKFLINESQVEKMVIKYINKLNYDKIIKKEKRPGGYSNVIFFVRKDNEGYADIRYNNWDGKCFIDVNLIDEINTLFSIDPDDYDIDAKDIIGEWVEETLNKKIPFHDLYIVGGWTAYLLNLELPINKEDED